MDDITLSGAAVQLPQYRSHKIVRAAKITALRGNGNPAMPDLVLGEIDCIVALLPEWQVKHKPQVGGYYVVYEDGYASYSPAKAFEEGYTPLVLEPLRIFNQKLAALLNEHSKENGSDTPDYILATYLIDCLGQFDSAVRAREAWYGRGREAQSIAIAEVGSVESVLGMFGGQTPQPEVESKTYADGSTATGPQPLPDQSPAEQGA